MVGSARTTLLLSKIVPAYAGPLRGIFEAKSVPKWVWDGVDGRLVRRTHLDPLLIRAYCRARRGGFLRRASQMIVTKKVRRQLAEVGALAASHISKAASRGALGTGLWGAWRRVSANHLPVYLDEMTWQFNDRKNPFLFRDTMLKLIASSNLEYKELTKAA